jgi:N-acetylneuraminate synthase/N,N'-diacetyllegionaminate synthase
MIQAIRTAEAALGDGVKRPAASELDTAHIARKSVVSQVDIPAGTTITAQMVAIKRPGTGILPRDLPRVIGRAARMAIPADTVIGWEMI